VYDDRLVGLIEKGDARVDRASHVEPEQVSGRGWIADMRPVHGPVIAANGQFASVGTYPIGTFTAPARSDFHKIEGFHTRAAALDAERAYLRTRFGI
jgi:hypothetical protein